MISPSDIESLEGDSKFQELKGLLTRFNVFEVLGIVRKELRHSDVLAFMMDPNESHGFGDAFFRAFLREVRLTLSETSIPLDDGYPEEAFSDLDVRREWRNIDLLCRSPRNGLVVLIENKIDSDEHGDQLPRYYETVQGRYSGSELPLYLTPFGTSPSDDRYHSISYQVVLDALEAVLGSESVRLKPEVRTFLEHYRYILKMHIMEDSEAAELARDIYREHGDTIDFIHAHRHVRRDLVRDRLETLIEEDDRFELDDDSSYKKRDILRFFPKDWNELGLERSTGWTSSNRILLFEFWVYDSEATFVLVIGPGPDEIRERLWMIQDESETFAPERNEDSKWWKLHKDQFMKPDAFNLEDPEEMLSLVEQRWEQLAHNELPAMADAVKDSLERTGGVA